MTANAVLPVNGDTSATSWYELAPDEVSKRLDVDPATGLSAAKVAELLKTTGPNALPAEPAVPGWKQFLAQYASYMQIIQAASLQIDASGLTGESVPASKSAELISGGKPGVGDQTNMAFMNSPGDARQRRDDCDGNGCQH